jgi:hypothetical protein
VSAELLSEQSLSVLLAGAWISLLSHLDTVGVIFMLEAVI